MDTPQRLLLLFRNDSAPTEVPANNSAPTISGTATVAQTLTANTGSWFGSPTSYAYQWYDDAVAIVGATSSTYVLTETEIGGNITVGVIATNAIGDSIEAVSAAVGPVAGLDAPVIALTSVSGTNPPEFSVTAANLEVGWYYQLDFTTNGTAPDGTADDTLLFTSAMALGDPVDWNAGPFSDGATIKWRLRYGPTITGPWSSWSNTLTDVMGAAVWSPADLGAKLLAWWDISDSTTRTITSGRVEQLDDLSGNANHLVQPTAGSRPVYSVTAWNSVLPGMDFNSGLSLNLTSGIAYSGATGLSIHAAIEQDATAASRTIVSGSSAGAPQFRLTSAHKLELVRSAQASIIVSTATFTTGWHLAGLDIATNVSDFHFNGTEETHTNNGAFTTALDRVGVNTAASEYFVGVLGEIVIAELLDATETSNLIAYLDAKWTP